MKPFKGSLYAWERHYFDRHLVPESLGYRVFGFRNPYLRKFGTATFTSAVVFYDEYTHRIETLNSWYQLKDD